MIYLGFFFVDEQSPGGIQASGEFTVLVDAESADKALEKFEKKILALRREGKDFAGDCVIHLKSLIGFPAVPPQAVALHCRKFAWHGGSLVSYYKAFLSEVPAGCEGYCAPEGDGPGDAQPFEPFLEFGEGKRGRLRVVK